jgi:hypothetical protein
VVSAVFVNIAERVNSDFAPTPTVLEVDLQNMSQVGVVIHPIDSIEVADPTLTIRPNIQPNPYSPRETRAKKRERKYRERALQDLQRLHEQDVQDPLGALVAEKAGGY